MSQSGLTIAYALALDINTQFLKCLKVNTDKAFVITSIIRIKPDFINDVYFP
jgi:hypothetical protein